MDIYKESLNLHKKLKGKLEIRSRISVKDKHSLSLAYTPGVAEVSKSIYSEPSKIFDLTMKGNCIGVVTDGSAVLGLGNIGAEASLPVMEGKALLFKELAGINAFPICIKSQEVEDIVKVVEMISPSFGGINLEDISSPRCFLIERELKKKLNIPVFHDDQHGTAVVVLSALINALKLTGRKVETTKILINGAGAAGIAITHFLHRYGFKDIIVCDSHGIIYKGRKEGMNFAKEEIAEFTNLGNVRGKLEEGIKNRDVFIGVSAKGVLKKEMVKMMRPNSIILAMANPEPEIIPLEAKDAGAKIVGTGRSDFPNQINNVLGFPGIFLGTLRAKSPSITEGMKMAASRALANVLEPYELSEEKILPDPLDKRVVENVSKAVEKEARNEMKRRGDGDW